MPQEPSNIIQAIEREFAAGKLEVIEQSKLFDESCSEDTFRQLLMIEFSTWILRGQRIHETDLTERFPRRASEVRFIFSEARENFSDSWHQFIPDPKKTQPGFLLDAFYQSTNIPLQRFEDNASSDAEPGTPAEVHLRVIRGPHEGKEQTFTESASIIVGRGDDAHWQLPDDSRCSRLHCRFEITPPVCSVVDLKSTNGTVVNGQRISRIALKDKDTVQVGLSRIRVHIQRPSSDSVHIAPSATFNPELDTPTIPGFELSDLLGAGRFGMVYSGIRALDGRSVAIKFLRGTANPDENDYQSFINEAAVSVKLKHRNIIETIDFGIHEDLPYLVMEKVETIELMPLLDELSPRRRELAAINGILQVLRGLEHAHNQGVLHRDLKPTNLLCSQVDDSKFLLKISDFGLARRMESSFAGEKAICGTAAYMAPEVISEPQSIGRVSDLFSIGICLYELLSGRRPWESNRLNNILFMILNEPPTPLSHRFPSASPGLVEVINKALSRRPDRRFQSAKEFSEALMALLPSSRR